MMIIPLTRREILTAVIALPISCAIARARAQRVSAQSLTLKTITVSGTEIRLLVSEYRSNGHYVLRTTFIRNGIALFETSTALDSNGTNRCRSLQTSGDGRGFIYTVEIVASQNAESSLPPAVSFRVTVQQSSGEAQEFEGKLEQIGSSDSRQPPGLDAVMPKEIHEELKPFTGPLEKRLDEFEQKSDGQFVPKKPQRENVWRGRGCRMLCWGVANIGTALCCGGTLGVGCIIGVFGFGAAASLCSDHCPA